MKKIIFIFILILIGYFFINSFLLGNENFYQLKNLLNTNTKQVIKKYIFPYKYSSDLENHIITLNKELQLKRLHVSKQNKKLSEQSSLISSLSQNIGFSTFLKKNSKTFNFLDFNIELSFFKNNFLTIQKGGGVNNNGGSFYIEKLDDNIFIASADGYFYYFNELSLKSQSFNAYSIKSNIKDIIKFKSFYENSKIGIKDLFILKNYIYISYTNIIKDECYNTSILRAKIDLNFLEFKNFFEPIECIRSDNTYFEPHSSGGRMVGYKNDILFSTGEFLDRKKAQDINSIFGKIVLINANQNSNKAIKDYKVVSRGHRNPQGLFYDELSNTIISTEHGPQGGDEININKNFINNIKNYGWPISSYGEHYGFKKRSKTHPIYKEAPLYKSHQKYGFIEPLKYFTPSIGISQVVKLDFKKFNDKNINNNLLVFGSLGWRPKIGSQSIHFMITDNDYSKVITHNYFEIKNRVRDIIIVNENSILLSLESNKSLAFVQLKK